MLHRRLCYIGVRDIGVPLYCYCEEKLDASHYWGISFLFLPFTFGHTTVKRLLSGVAGTPKSSLDNWSISETYIRTKYMFVAACYLQPKPHPLTLYYNIILIF